jgi:type II secretory pathway pseudopilin PulG
MKHRGGYTIVEVMIFLAVSGVLFVSAVQAVSGRQRNSEYSIAARDTEAIIKDVINDVRDGYYPRASNFRCQEQPAGVINIQASGGEDLGENSDCVYMGRALFFENATAYIYTIVGLRTNTNTLAVVDSVTETRNLQYGFESADEAGDKNAGIAIIYNTIATLAANTGASSTIAVAKLGTNPSRSDFRENLGNKSNYQFNAAPVVCFRGGTGKYAAYSVGAANSLSVTTTQGLDDVAGRDCL